VAVLAAGLLVTGVVAAPAAAYRFAGPRWPNDTIAVASGAPRYEDAVREAIRAWNRSRIGVRFTRSPMSRARVVFRYARGQGFGRYGCEGIAGGTGAGYPSPFVTMEVFVIRSCRNQALRRLTAMHELGHVLGLGHERRRCALMNPSGDVGTMLPSLCGLGTRVPTRDDVRGARSLYRQPAPHVDRTIALFNPGDGSRLPFNGGAIRFSAAARNPALQYRWGFGEPDSGAENLGRGLDVMHVYAKPGVYTVRLRVLDGGVVIATARNEIELF